MLLIALLSILALGVVTYLAHEIFGRPSSDPGRLPVPYLPANPAAGRRYRSDEQSYQISDEPTVLQLESKRFIINRLNQLSSCYQHHDISEEEYLQQADKLIDKLSELMASA